MNISLLTPYTVLAQDYTNLKKNIRVAIFSVQDQVNHNRFGRLDRVILETLTTELVKSNNFTVIDRQQIESLIKEQGFQRSGLITDQTAVSLGKMLGVQLGIFGTITLFDVTSGSGEGLTSLMLRSATDNKYKYEETTSKGKIELDIKIIDIKTGEIILAEKAKAKSTITNSKSEGFTKEVISKSANKACKSIIKKMTKASAKIPWEATITNVIDNKKVVINGGLASGVQNGLVFTVQGKGEEIIDPTTGISLGFIESTSGKIRVINNELGAGKASLCTIIDESFNVNVGDIVRIPKDRKVPVYCFYNNNNKDHFYSVKNSKPKKGKWESQGIEFYVFTDKNASEKIMPIYQYYHKKNKDHFYTKNPSPKSKHWENRIIAFYAFLDETKGSIPIYRFYHEKNKDHFYSKNLTAKGNAKDQGVEFHAFPNP